MDINDKVKALVKEVLEEDSKKDRFVFPFRTEIYKEMTMDASHQLPNHDGKCANHHGHTYTIKVGLESFLSSEVGDTEEGMVLDHKYLKQAMKYHVDSFIDHQFLNTTLSICDKFFRTTAEQIAWWVFVTLDDVFSDYNDAVSRRLVVKSVEVHETPTSSAIARRENFDKDQWKSFLETLNHGL